MTESLLVSQLGGVPGEAAERDVADREPRRPMTTRLRASTVYRLRVYAAQRETTVQDLVDAVLADYLDWAQETTPGGGHPWRDTPPGANDQKGNLSDDL